MSLESAQKVTDILSSTRFTLIKEKDLQDQIQKAFQSAELQFKREFHLTKTDIIDFYLPEPQMGIEIKINRAENSLLRQCIRYLKNPQLKSLMTVTIRPPQNFPPTLAGKPLYTFALWNRLKVF